MHRTDQGRGATGSAPETSRPSIDRSAKSCPSLQRSTSVTATHSTSFAVRRSRVKHLRSQPSIDSCTDMISPEEYASLPATIQKKYFSSKERLCIAQQSAAQVRKKQHGKLGSWLSSTPSTDLLPTRPSTSAGLHSLKPKLGQHDPKLFSVHFDEDSVSEEEARWFLSLPEKIKTKRFSREELVSLTAISHRVIGKASGLGKRDTPQRRRSVHRLESSASVPIGTALSSSTSSTAGSNNSRASSADTNEVEQAQHKAITSSRVPTEVVEISKIKRPLHDLLPTETDQAVETASNASDAEMEILRLYLQRRSMKTKASDSKIKRSPPDSPPASSTQPTKKGFHHRHHMLKPLPLPPPVLAPAPTAQTHTPFSASARLSRPFLNNDPLATESGAVADEKQLDAGPQTPDEAPDVRTPAPRAQTNTPFSTSARLSRPFLNNSPLEAETDERQLDAGAQVPDEAPAIVLHYEGHIFELAANEDVLHDEGHVFQLPANEEPPSISTDEDCPYPHLASALSDDDMEVDDNLDAESVETVGPRTPSPLDHRDSTVQQARGDSGIDLPESHLDARSKSTSALGRNSSTLSHYGSKHDSIGPRAHVLRTSTEEILYAYQRWLTSGVDVETADPLALETLPVCDDETGAKGAFAMSHTHDGSAKAPTKGMRGMLRTFSRL